MKQSRNQQKEREIVARLHKLVTRDRVETEVRQSDPDLGISTIKIKQGKQEITIPLNNNNLSNNRNQF